MADIVNTGATANDGSGDDLRTAFRLINERFQDLLGTLSQITWAPGLAITATPLRQWTVVSGQAYVAASNHVAGATFAADLTAGRWLAVDVAQLTSDLASPASGNGAELVGSNDGAGGSLWTTVSGFIARIVSSSGASVVGFLQTGVGAIMRTLADRGRETVSPLDFMTEAQREDVLTGAGLIDVTAAINTASATNKNLEWPDGVLRIEGTIIGGSGGWYGKGQSSDAYGSVWNGSGTFLRVIGANGGAAHIKPPRDFQGFHIDGVDKTAIGIDLGQNASFTAFQRWKRITVRRCADALRGFNFYSTSLEDVIIQGNMRGITIAPTDGAGDDGYFTASQWKNVHIADNDVYGLNVDVPQGTRTWTWENVVIERNGTDGGTYQARLKNAKVTGNGIYIEASPSVPGIKTEVASLFGCDWYFNGTGGLDASNQSLVMGVELLQMTGASDVLANIPSTARIALKNSSIRTDVRAGAYVVELQNVNINGVAEQQYNRMGRLAIGQAPGTDYQPTETRMILSGKKTYSGTINAGAGVNIVGDQYFPGIMADGAGFGSVQAYHPGLLVQVTPATSGSTDYYCVRLVNTTSANITLTAAQINWTILRSIPQAL